MAEHSMCHPVRLAPVSQRGLGVYEAVGQCTAVQLLMADEKALRYNMRMNMLMMLDYQWMIQIIRLWAQITCLCMLGMEKVETLMYSKQSCTRNVNRSGNLSELFVTNRTPLPCKGKL